MVAVDKGPVPWAVSALCRWAGSVLPGTPCPALPGGFQLWFPKAPGDTAGTGGKGRCQPWLCSYRRHHSHSGCQWWWGFFYALQVLIICFPQVGPAWPGCAGDVL